MKNKDYHAKIVIYGLNKDVSVQHIVEWLKKEADYLENNKEEIDENKYTGKLMK